VQTGYFRSNASKVEAWSIVNWPDNLNATSISLKLGNAANASGLNIRARKANGASGTWNYRITYRAL